MVESVIYDLPQTSRVLPRRLFLLEVTAAFAAACAPTVPELPTPSENRDRTHPSTIPVPDIQSKYVGEILEIEDSFKGSLANGDSIIRRHIELVAGMYHNYYNTTISVDQMAGGVLLIPTTEEFVRYLKQVKNFSGNFTDQENRQIVARFLTGGTAVVNLQADFFNAAIIQKGIERKMLPQAWNPARTLRTTLAHEWGHDIVGNSTDPILSLLDPKNRYPSKRFEGFRVKGLTDLAEGIYPSDIKPNTEHALRYSELDEAAVELLAARPNVEFFPKDRNFYSSYPDYHGSTDGITQMGLRLNRLKDACRVGDDILYRRHYASDVGQFFFLLLRRTGFLPGDPMLATFFVQSVINTIISGDPKNMEKYVNGALKYTPD